MCVLCPRARDRLVQRIHVRAMRTFVQRSGFSPLPRAARVPVQGIRRHAAVRSGLTAIVSEAGGFRWAPALRAQRPGRSGS